jgi:hypothetical protein
MKFATGVALTTHVLTLMPYKRKHVISSRNNSHFSAFTKRRFLRMLQAVCYLAVLWVLPVVAAQEEDSPFASEDLERRYTFDRASSIFKVTDEALLALIGCSSAKLTPCYVKSVDEFGMDLLKEKPTEALPGNHRTWHTLCDNKGPTLTLIQADNGWLFGGYTQVSWDLSSGYGYDETAFLFTDKGTAQDDYSGAFKKRGGEWDLEDGAYRGGRFTRIPVTRTKLYPGDPSPPSHRAMYRTGYSGPRFGVGFDLYVAADMNSGWTTSRDYSHYMWPCNPPKMVGTVGTMYADQCNSGGLAGTWGEWQILEMETMVVSQCVKELAPANISHVHINSATSEGPPTVATLALSLLVAAQLLLTPFLR